MSEFNGFNRIAGYRPARGFTLVELMITIFVAVILLALALPSFRETTFRTKLTANTNNLMVAISLARSEATKRGVPVAVIAKSGTTNWGNSGWDVQVSGTNEEVRTFGPSDTGYIVTSKTTTTTCTGTCSSDGQIVFDATGALVGASKVDLNVCRPDKKASEQNRVVISPAGIASSYRDTTSSPAPAC